MLVFTFAGGESSCARTSSVAISSRISTTSRAALRFSTSGESAGGILFGCVMLGALLLVWVLALMGIGDAVVVLSGRDRQGCVVVFGKAEGLGGDW